MVDAPRKNRLETRVGFHTEQGPRPRNEDYVGVHVGTPDQLMRFGAVAVIADGVGGAKGGRVAAELAVRGFIEGHLGQNEMLGVRHTSARSIEAINRWLHALGRTDADLEGLSCTLTGLVLRGRQAYVTHVGDTRLYRWRDERLVRLTLDHVLGPGMRNVLTRAVGAGESVQIDYAVETTRVHDRYLLCSDGVHGPLSDRAIGAELAQRRSPQETAQTLVEAALAAGGGDNATALVLDVLDLPPANRLDLEHAIAARPILPPPKAGAVVDGFELEAMLSDGKYTRVFRALDQVGKRSVIIKFPKPLVGAEAVLRQAFLREAWIAARVRSPWVVELLDVPDERRSRSYLVTPYYQGETLEQRLRRGPLPLATGLTIAIKLAKAVAALHRAGVVHRDIKPENVVLEEAGAPGEGLKLIDLGVARLPNMEDFGAEHAPGTPSYMAPELLAGAEGDERSDLFALGVTIYRMFSGAYPYGEIEPFSRPRFGAPVSLLTRRPDLPAWLDQTLARAVAVAPTERFGDVLELAFELEHGALRAAPARPRRRPLYDRDPLLFWQVTAGLLAVALFLALAFRT
jgi:serine/threonine protein phosphatase PrpC